MTGTSTQPSSNTPPVATRRSRIGKLILTLSAALFTLISLGIAFLYTVSIPIPSIEIRSKAPQAPLITLDSRGAHLAYPLILVSDNPTLTIHWGDLEITAYAKITKMHLSPKAALYGTTPLKKLMIDSGSVTLRLDHSTNTMELKGLNLTVDLPDSNALQIERCEFSLGNVFISISGAFKNALKSPPHESSKSKSSVYPEPPSTFPQALVNIISTLSKITTESEGTVQIELNADATNLEAISGRLIAELKKLQLDATIIQNLQADIHISPNSNSNPHLEFKIRTGQVYHPVRNVESTETTGTIQLPRGRTLLPEGKITTRLKTGVWDLGTFQDLVLNLELLPITTPHSTDTKSWNYKLLSFLQQVTIRTELDITNFSLWGGPVKFLSAQVSWSSPSLVLSNLLIGFAEGLVTASAEANLDSRWFKFQAESTCDPRSLWPFLTDSGRKLVTRFTFKTPPTIRIEGCGPLPRWDLEQGDFSPKVEKDKILITGRIQGKTFTWHGIQIDSADVTLVYSNSTMFLPRAIFAYGNSSLCLSLTNTSVPSREITTSFYGSLDPTIMSPLIPTNITRALTTLVFQRPINISGCAKFSGHPLKPESIKISLQANGLGFRGHFADHLTANVAFSNNIIQILQPTVSVSNQTAHADLVSIDLTTRKISIKNARGQVNPLTVAELVNPKIAQTLRPFVFPTPPTGSVTGLIPLRGKAGMELRIELQGSEFQWWRIHLKDYSATVHLVDEHLDLVIHRGDFYSGNIWLQAHFDWSGPVGTDFRISSTYTNVALDSLLKDLLVKTPKAAGALTGHVMLTSGNTEDMTTWSGYGKIAIADGYLWELPLFSVLSPIIDAAFPGLGSTKFTEGSATFTITNGIIHSQNLTLKSKLMEMVFQGSVDFRGQLDARMCINVFKELWVIGPVISGVMSPFVKALEFQITGSLNSPSIKPLYLPKELMYPLRPFSWLIEQLPARKNSK